MLLKSMSVVIEPQVETLKLSALLTLHEHSNARQNNTIQFNKTHITVTLFFLTSATLLDRQIAKCCYYA